MNDSTTTVGDDDAGRAFQAASTMLSGILAISASQAIGAPLKLMDAKLYRDYMAWTKESFAVLVTSITQWWAPTDIKVSGDDSMKDQLFQMSDGSLKCNLPHRMVLMANHQLYTDWLYLWWIAYTNKMHGHIYIIMKESLKQLPILGWGAQLYNFVFLSRKWETDQSVFRQALSHLCSPRDPMWLLIFPEGTNLSAFTREQSAKWAKKSNIKDMKHQLLPRSKGLQFCLQELQTSTNWLYDCTIAYEGVPEGSYGQDIYTLHSSFLGGKPPKAVNMHWRRFRISEIPLDNVDAFARWLNNRWREKDYLLEYFAQHKRFPAGPVSQTLKRLQRQMPVEHTRYIGTQIKGEGWNEFLGIFEPVTSLSGMLSNVDLTEPISMEAILQKVLQDGSAKNGSLKKVLTTAQRSETARKVLKEVLAKGALSKSLQGSKPPTVSRSLKQQQRPKLLISKNDIASVQLAGRKSRAASATPGQAHSAK
ncbi:hypothetical protein AMS68_001597 [Peltaster fructicola]|uniref:Phospholipid/glycerol acyltransferase domain-containing protein n=1 Tax=Peltaster fructicola TaxID=286661 RepID=A0A6H0XNL8_9PEZI|nr:hypothetical protein AMS68_001597 [Peltaster fructicola]